MKKNKEKNGLGIASIIVFIIGIAYILLSYIEAINAEPGSGAYDGFGFGIPFVFFPCILFSGVLSLINIVRCHSKKIICKESLLVINWVILILTFFTFILFVLLIFFY